MKIDKTDPETGKVYELEGPSEALIEYKWQEFQFKKSKQQAQPETPERTPVENLARGAGLSGRALVTGGMGLPNMVGDVANAGINWGIRGVNAATGTKIPYLDLPSHKTQQLMTEAGVPAPETTAERLIYGDIAPAVLGGGGYAKAFERAAGAVPAGVTQKVLDVLGQGQGMQAVSNVAGSTAAGIARENEAPPWVQMLAGMAGGAAPGAKAGFQSGVRGFLRGGEEGRQVYEQRLKDFQDAGVDPTVGQASGNRRAQGLEAGLLRTPGGAGPLTAHAERVAEQMKAKVEALADRIFPSANATKAGLTIEKGLQQFTERIKAESTFLYDKLDQHIPKDTPVGVSNSTAALAQLNADIQGAPALSKMFKNSTIQAIETALKSDVGKTGVLPWEALTKLRTLVGREITDYSLTSTVPRSKWKALYAALSEDMRAAATQYGPDAERAFTRANTYYRAANDRIDSVLDRVRGGETKTAEGIYKSTVYGPEVSEGSTTLDAVMKSITPGQRDVVTAATIRRLGDATPGTQSAAGDRFSSQTFLTNWNRFSDSAKRTLFADPDARAGLDALALAAERIAKAQKVFGNPSGTTQATANVTATSGLTGALLTGNLGVAATIAGVIGTVNAGARLLTNPRFVQWVGQTTKFPPGQFGAQLNVLAQQARNWSPEDQDAVTEFLGKVK